MAGPFLHWTCIATINYLHGENTMLAHAITRQRAAKVDVDTTKVMVVLWDKASITLCTKNFFFQINDQ